MTVVTLAFVLRLWYAVPDPNGNRNHFYDERYTFENIGSILYGQTHRPITFWYPPFSYAPQTLILAGLDRLHDATGWEALRVAGPGGFTPLAYLVGRMGSVVYGTLTVLLLFIVGRRLFGADVGLIAAFLLSVTLVHVHHSGFFKPDALLTLACLLVVYIGILAAERPDLRRLVAAGLAVGLASAAKFNGLASGVALLPLAFARFRSLGSRVLRLAAWAGTALVTALVLNPWVGPTFRFLEMNEKRYASQALKYGGTHANVPVKMLENMLGPAYLGPVVGGVALLGLLILTVRCGLPGQSREERLRVAIPLTFFYGYIGACAVGTPYTRWTLALPVAPVLWLGGGWALVEGYRWLAGSASVRRVVGGATLGLILAWAGAMGFGTIYRSLTDTTSDVAQFFVRKDLPVLRGRMICIEWPGPDWGVRRGSDVAVTRYVPDLTQMSGSERALCDAEVWRLDHAREVNLPALGVAGKRGGGVQVNRAMPRWFEVRGPALLVVSHPWEKIHDVELTLTSEKPPPAATWDAESRSWTDGGQPVSILVSIRGSGWRRADPSLQIGEQELPLHWAGRLGRGPGMMLSTRRLSSQPTGRLRIRSKLSLQPDQIRVWARIWGSPAGAVVSPRDAR